MKRNKRYKYRRKFFELRYQIHYCVYVISFEMSIISSIIRISFANVKNKTVICIVLNIIIPLRYVYIVSNSMKIKFVFFFFFFLIIKSYIHIDIKYLTYYKFYIEKFHPLCWICKFSYFQFLWFMFWYMCIYIYIWIQ